MIRTFLMLLLLLVTIGVVLQKNHQKLIVFFSAFSLLAGSLYFYNHAPDVALAEIAVGSAFIPLIFLITISKQRTFTVMLHADVAFIFDDLFDEFCKEENLKLKVIEESAIFNDEARSVFGVFRRQDIDLIIGYNRKKKRYDMTCKKSNVMINRFEVIAQKYHKIRIIRIVDDAMID